MSRKSTQLFFLALSFLAFAALTQTTRAQSGNPTPGPLNRPDYNYSESNGCTRCHFIMGALGDHNLEAVGVKFNDEKRAFELTGNGWRASAHSQSNYGSTQNTYCSKCHSPLQADPKAEFKPGKSEPLPAGKVEGVTCASCHPSHDSAVVLGRRLGIYKLGEDKNKPEAYEVIHEGEEDRVCFTCHSTRHNEGNPAFDLMYVAGVRCIDCHMAPYGQILGTDKEKRFHDFKVAKNLPYSCGVEGSLTHCHPEFSAEATAAFIPYMKDQHREMWARDKTTKKLRTAADYLRLWKDLEAQKDQGSK
ncbi:MAG TPA: multiheme c-type cytochrome [Blastocatellia bacterium]|nr:multiheme c-type cytochrome [Blastocatellia bacterium]